MGVFFFFLEEADEDAMGGEVLFEVELFEFEVEFRRLEEPLLPTAPWDDEEVTEEGRTMFDDDDDAAFEFEFDAPSEVVVVPEVPPPPARGRPRLRLRLPIEAAEALAFGFPGADFLVGNPLPMGMLFVVSRTVYYE